LPADVLGFRVAFALAFGLIMIVALEALPLDHLPQLSHEKLEVYQKSIALLALSTQVLSTVPRGHAQSLAVALWSVARFLTYFIHFKYSIPSYTIKRSFSSLLKSPCCPNYA